MKVSELINSSAILLNFEAKNKKEAIRKLAEKFHEVHPKVDPKLLLSSLLQREALGSTGLGNGIAIPTRSRRRFASRKVYW